MERFDSKGDIERTLGEMFPITIILKSKFCPYLIKEWCNETIGDNMLCEYIDNENRFVLGHNKTGNWTYSRHLIYLRSGVDAVAFKLRWSEKISSITVKDD